MRQAYKLLTMDSMKELIAAKTDGLSRAESIGVGKLVGAWTCARLMYSWVQRSMKDKSEQAEERIMKKRREETTAKETLKGDD